MIDRSVAVSIGYSFPPLNREFDQKIISKIGKLYIQCLEKDYPFIEARVKALNGNLKIEPWVDTSEFLIPHELQEYALSIKYKT